MLPRQLLAEQGPGKKYNDVKGTEQRVFQQRIEYASTEASSGNHLNPYPFISDVLSSTRPAGSQKITLYFLSCYFPILFKEKKGSKFQI